MSKQCPLRDAFRQACMSLHVQVATEQGYNFDEDELKAMMEVAAATTQRASTTSMTFQGFQKLVQHYSTIT